MAEAQGERGDTQRDMNSALETDVLRIENDQSGPILDDNKITVHLRTVDASVDASVNRSAAVDRTVRRALGIPAAKHGRHTVPDPNIPGVKILLGGQSIVEGSFESNGVQTGAIIDVVMEQGPDDCTLACALFERCKLWTSRKASDLVKILGEGPDPIYVTSKRINELKNNFAAVAHEPERNPLIVAVKAGNAVEVRRLVQEGNGMNLEGVDKERLRMMGEHHTPGRTALLWAVEYCRVDCLRLLIEAGADVNKGTTGFLGDGATPAWVATKKNDGNCLRMLIEAGADVNKGMITSGVTPAFTASQEGFAHCLRMLIDAGTHSTNLSWGLGMAAMNGHTDCLRMLIEARADVNFVSTASGGATALVFASVHGHIDCMRLLIEAGADVTIPAMCSGVSLTPLQFTTQRGLTECADLIRAQL